MPAVPAVAEVPAAPVALAAAEGGAAWRHPVTVIFLSELEVVGVVVCGGVVVCATSPTVAIPTMAAKVPDQIRFLMLPPRNIRLATIRPSQTGSAVSADMDPWLHAYGRATCNDRRELALSFRGRDRCEPGGMWIEIKSTAMRVHDRGVK